MILERKCLIENYQAFSYLKSDKRAVNSLAHFQIRNSD